MTWLNFGEQRAEKKSDVLKFTVVGVLMDSRLASQLLPFYPSSQVWCRERRITKGGRDEAQRLMKSFTMTEACWNYSHDRNQTCSGATLSNIKKTQFITSEKKKNLFN